MKTQLYILTGFLGAGKTTVLMQILAKLKDKKVGVIQNEIGKISIDGEVIRNDHIKMVELNRGSIFCTCLKLSFVKALAEMAQYDFEYLFVESSGWGDPSNMQEILDAAGILCGDKYDLRGVICVVDAANFIEQLSDKETVNRQLKHCNLALISKADIVDEERIGRVKAEIEKINPVCDVIPLEYKKAELSFLDEDLMLKQWAKCEESTNSIEDKPKTLFMDIDGKPNEKALRAFLESLSQSLYRAKGFCETENLGWCKIDLVGRQIDIAPCETKRQAQIVFISKTGTAVIKEIFASWEKYVSVPMKLRN